MSKSIFYSNIQDMLDNIQKLQDISEGITMTDGKDRIYAGHVDGLPRAVIVNNGNSTYFTRVDHHSGYSHAFTEAKPLYASISAQVEEIVLFIKRSGILVESDEETGTYILPETHVDLDFNELRKIRTGCRAIYESALKKYAEGIIEAHKYIPMVYSRAKNAKQ